ncbi:SDR family oxidoreductase [Streptomyces yaizuensis]|uniref:SDR family NAD(P)-dependent oxidoreductase n=1 Tax=Streptomyces yaizuensis TaxID=2989713 RepID=A0ABQ5P7J1_9ACTN|nr:SDR family oxidoreductase [Streptomyces sp. YSPA8]GLF98532.1 SDR family NAD(P)-dependent oxidoreductase [Streptomyces sp. YSPA8]
MAGICRERVVVVTGAGRGLGRAHALAFAAEGARLVVNDLGTGLDGAGASVGPAHAVADEIRAAGGEAVPHTGDIATGAGAASLVATALDAYGRLDTLVNNAGFLRDRMLVNLAEDDWDAVLRVHAKGHFLPLRHAAAHWRAEAKAGRPVAARVVNTTSGAGLLGSVGQGNYAAAKAAVVALTLVAAAELTPYGVQVNAIAPAARTRMTEEAFAGLTARPEDVSPLVVWLGSADCAGVTGRVFEAEADRITVMTGWRPGPTARAPRPDGPTARTPRAHGPATGPGPGPGPGPHWTPAGAGAAARALLARAEPPLPVYGTRPPSP